MYTYNTDLRSKLYHLHHLTLALQEVTTLLEIVTEHDMGTIRSIA